MAGRTLLSIGGMLAESRLLPGDIALQGEQFFSGGLTTAGAGTITGAMVAAGLLYRTGPAAGFTDTLDTATNILAALGLLNVVLGTNNQWGAGLTDASIGSTFRFRYILGVAFAMTMNATAPEGIIYGTAGGSGLGIAGVAGNWRDYLFTINNTSQRQSFSVVSNTSTTTTLSSPVPVGTITPGMWLSGTNVTSGTLVTGVIHGQGVITGFTTSAASTGSATQAWVFSPTITVNNLGSGVL